jgi:methylthioribulose-1-phosphate dehydratase
LKKSRLRLRLAGPDLVEAKTLATLVRSLSAAGHSPATSGNYSFRSSVFPDRAYISQSGVDKSAFAAAHLIPVVVATGEVVSGPRAEKIKISDEAPVHLQAYRSTSARCVLHSHLLEALLFADLFPGQKEVSISGLELLKGFRGIKSHEASVPVPLFENTQDMSDLAARLGRVLERGPSIYGFILRRHGLYVWGESVAEAKRHLEVLEYVFKYQLRSRGNSL